MLRYLILVGLTDEPTEWEKQNIEEIIRQSGRSGFTIPSLYHFLRLPLRLGDNFSYEMSDFEEELFVMIKDGLVDARGGELFLSEKGKDELRYDAKINYLCKTRGHWLKRESEKK